MKPEQCFLGLFLAAHQHQLAGSLGNPGNHDADPGLQPATQSNVDRIGDVFGRIHTRFANIGQIMLGHVRQFQGWRRLRRHRRIPVHQGRALTVHGRVMSKVLRSLREIAQDRRNEFGAALENEVRIGRAFLSDGTLGTVAQMRTAKTTRTMRRKNHHRIIQLGELVDPCVVSHRSQCGRRHLPFQ